MFNLFSFKPSNDKFAEIVQEHLAKSGACGPFEYREDDFTLRSEKSVFHMTDMYEEYCSANRERRETILGRIASIFQQLNQSATREEALSTVVAVVRERALFAFTSLLWQLEDHQSEAGIAHEPISSWYTRSLVLDAPGSMASVTQKQLSDWGMTFDEMFAVGLEKLRESTSMKFREEDGYFAGTWNDDYDGSRVLLPGLFQELALDGDPVFTTPNRLTLMVTGSRNEAGIRAMAQKAEEILQTKPRPQNPSLLTYKDGKLQDFKVDASSPLLPVVRRAEEFSASAAYAEQAIILEDLHEKAGKDYFIAKYTAVQKEGGDLFSYSVWSKGIPTLLPKTNQICFFDDGSDLRLTVPFENALGLVSDLMLDTRMFPGRYYVSAFPSEEQFVAMGAQGI